MTLLPETKPKRRRLLKTSEKTPLYVVIDKSEYDYLENLAECLGQTKARTLTEFLRIAREGKWFDVEHVEH